MMITSASYDEEGYIVMVSDGVTMIVPDDMDNRHRSELAEWVGEGNTIAPYTPPAPTTDDVDAERDRRIAGGFSFGGKVYQTRADDRENILGAYSAALTAVINGAQEGDYRWHGGDSDFTWIAADNSTTVMDAQTMILFGKAALSHKQNHIFAARVLKDMAEIPDDFADDSYWPTV